MKSPFGDAFDNIFGEFLGQKTGEQTTETRTIVKCAICAQKNRLPINPTFKSGPLGPKCGRCKSPLRPV